MSDKTLVAEASRDGAATRHVLFIQGGGDGAYEEDRLLADSLRRVLGPRFKVRYPAMPNEGEPSYETWRQQIEQALSDLPGPVVIVGHSLGASVVMKWLGERSDETALAGVFLLACPFWGGDGWRYEGDEEWVLPPGFAANIPTSTPVVLYHCRDDEIAPFDHLPLCARALPQATVRAFDDGGHQFNNDLSTVAQDIASLPTPHLN